MLFCENLVIMENGMYHLIYLAHVWMEIRHTDI